MFLRHKSQWYRTARVVWVNATTIQHVIGQRPVLSVYRMFKNFQFSIFSIQLRLVI